MAQRTHPRSDDDPRGDEPVLTARDAVDIARQYITELTKLEGVQMTSVQPAEDGGWILEVQALEERRIPSSSDILALYEVDLDADGQLLSYRRTRRYLRSQTSDNNGGVLA